MPARLISRGSKIGISAGNPLCVWFAGPSSPRSERLSTRRRPRRVPGALSAAKGADGHRAGGWLRTTFTRSRQCRVSMSRNPEAAERSRAAHATGIVAANVEWICSASADLSSEKMNTVDVATDNSWIANFCTPVKKMWICWRSATRHVIAGVGQRNRHRAGKVRDWVSCIGILSDFYWSTRRWGGPGEHQPV